jgi:hypothetical protein
VHVSRASLVDNLRVRIQTDSSSSHFMPWQRRGLGVLRDAGALCCVTRRTRFWRFHGGRSPPQGRHR